MSSEDFLVMHAQLCSEHSYLWRRKWIKQYNLMEMEE
jgi:hypothetical protein